MTRKLIEKRVTAVKDLSRRAFLAAAGAAAASLPAAAIAQDTDPLPIDGSGLPAGPEYSFVQPQRARLNLWGRITEWGTPIRVQPGLGNEVSTFIGQNQVIPLLEEIRAEGTNPRNDLWYRVPQGYIYTDRVQPMRPYRMPQIITDITTTIAGEPG
ncbi:MAG: twin-arginine translocation signal domain-containing protein, partial [Chloroflexi bacterium]|nr:twin-arginine translocation signal domain-containing protein [Chloroflexota bacterium]